LQETFTDSLHAFDPRSTAFAAARSVIATAQVGVLVANPPDVLLPVAPGDAAGVHCDGISAISLWCLGSTYGAWPQVVRVLAIVVLVVTAIGYRPRWTCVPHWYVSFSISSALVFANGGDQVAQIVTMLMIPACLGDTRAWQWRTARDPMPAGWRGAAFAAQLALILQAAFIYLYTATAKAVVPQWQDGSAMRAIAHHPSYGFPDSLLALADRGPVPWLMLATWAAPCAEFLVGLLLLAGPRGRRWALVLGTVLHTSILLAMGLASFELIMIGLLIAAATRSPSTAGR
jgi:antimicrobial peptide system SdpB family protein